LILRPCPAVFCIAGQAPAADDPAMFIVSKAEAAAIRAAFEQGGELSASVELRRLFPGLANNENTRICARTIADWTPLPPMPEKPPRAVRTHTT
jgi:hypothetical protein